MARTKIQILRKDPSDLPKEVIALLEQAFPGAELIRTDPADCHEHMAATLAHGNAPALLPLDTPIPALAMKAGVPQLVLMEGPNGPVLKKLVGITPVFEDL